MAKQVLMKGNEALAEAAVLAGCRHYFGYPITPQTEIAAYLAKRIPQVGGVFFTRRRAKLRPSTWSTARPPRASAR